MVGLFYQEMLESMASALEGLNTQGYRWADSDRWRRARTLDATRKGTRHLEFWIDLGKDTSLRGRTGLLHERCELTVVCRYSLDDNFRAQGIIRNAGLAAIGALLAWGYPSIGARVVPEGMHIESTDSEWARVAVPFHLLIAEWR